MADKLDPTTTEQEAARQADQEKMKREQASPGTGEKEMTSSEVRSELQQAAEEAERTPDHVEEAIDHVQDEASRLADDLTATAKAAASEMGDAAQDDVRAIGYQAAGQAAEQARNAREMAAQKIHTAAEAVRRRSILQEATVIDQTARRLDGVADYVHDREFGEMKADFEKSVQKAPLFAVSLSFLVGLLVGMLRKRG